MSKEKYDLFISHNSLDKSLIDPLVEQLYGGYDIRCWLDKWDIPAAADWAPRINQALQSCMACAVVLGANGWGPHHLEEARLALQRKVERDDFRVIPILLPGATAKDIAVLGDFFQRIHRVDFSNGMDDAEAFRRLLASIQGEAPGPPPMTVFSIRRDAERWKLTPNKDKSSVLYSGGELREAQKLAQDHASGLTDLAVKFLSASAAEEQRHLVAEKKRTKRIISALAAALVIFICLGAWAWSSSVLAESRRQEALAQKQEAEAQRAKAEEKEREAVTQRGIAEENFRKALESEREANKQKEEANKQKEQAEAAAEQERIAKKNERQQREKAEQATAQARTERNLALSRESHLLAAESKRNWSQGRYAQALDLAMQAFPNSGDQRARPYTPQAEAALIAATLGSPIYYQARREPGGVAGLFVSTDGDQVLELIYPDKGLLHRRAAQGATQLSIPNILTYDQKVDCHSILVRVRECLGFHGGMMSLGCRMPIIYPGYTLGDLYQTCSRAVRDVGEVSERDTAMTWPRAIELAERVDVQVPIKLSEGVVRSNVAPRFDSGLLAVYDPSRRSVQIINLVTGAEVRSIELADELIALTWMSPSDLCMFQRKRIDWVETGTWRLRSIESAAVHTGFAPVPSEEVDHWVGITTDARPIWFRSEDRSIHVEGHPSGERILNIGLLDDRSGYFWATGEDISAGRLHIWNRNDRRAIVVDQPVANLLTVLALNDGSVAVISGGRITVNDRTTGRQVHEAKLPVADVTGAWLLQSHTYFRTLFPEFFGELPSKDSKILLVTKEGKAFSYGVLTGELTQMDLHGARVQDVQSTPTALVIAADDQLEDGYSHVFTVQRTAAAEYRSFSAPERVGGRIDFVSADESGRFIVFSEDNRRLLVARASNPAPQSYCSDLPKEDQSFFHVQAVGPRGFIGVGEHAVCRVGVGKGAASLRTEFHINEILYSHQARMTIVGDTGWGLFTLSDDASVFKELPDSKGELGALALSFDESMLFAVVDGELRAWDLSNHLRATAPRTKAVGTAKVYVALANPKFPLLAVGTIADGYPSEVILLNYQTGESQRSPWKRLDGLQFSPDGRLLAILDDDQLRILDARTGKVKYLGLDGSVPYLERLSFDPTSRYVLALPNRDIVQKEPNVVRVWDTRGEPKPRRLVMPDGAKNAQFSSDGKSVLVQDEDGHSAIFSTTTGDRIHDLDQFKYVSDIGMFANRDRWVFTAGSIDRVLRISDHATGLTFAELQVDFGSSVNNRFGQPNLIMSLPEEDAIIVASRASGLILHRFYFDERRLRNAAKLVSER